MPSSPIPAVGPQLGRATELMALLAQVPDPRDPRGVRYPLDGILAVAVSAVLAGARSFSAIASWAGDLPAQDLARLGVGSTPEESTLRKLFARLDADKLDQLIGAFLWIRTAVVGRRRVLAVDGKTVRGARTRGDGQHSAPHLVAAFDHTAGAVLGQVAVTAKSNEIPAVRTLLASFDLTNTVVSMDAMHVQSDTAAAITNAGGDYLVTVKGNQPGLHAACKDLPWTQVPSHTALETSRGRRVRRTIKVVQAPAWIVFPGAAQIAQIRRTVTKAGRKSIEVVYIITSANCQDAPPTVLAAWVQGHWSIENRLHWVRDVSFDEDRSQVRTGNAPRVMATLRNTAISLLRLTGWTNMAAALRHHARHPDQTLTCILTC